jgi:hypothetical protein
MWHKKLISIYLYIYFVYLFPETVPSMLTPHSNVHDNPHWNYAVSSLLLVGPPLPARLVEGRSEMKKQLVVPPGLLWVDRVANNPTL